MFNVAKISEIIHSEIGDIRDFEKLRQSISTFDPDILFHMAAQSLVRQELNFKARFLLDDLSELILTIKNNI